MLEMSDDVRDVKLEMSDDVRDVMLELLEMVEMVDGREPGRMLRPGTVGESRGHYE